MREVLAKTRGWLRGAGLLALLFAQGAVAQVTFPLDGNGSMGLGDPNGDFFVAQDDLQVKVPGGYARINRDFDGQRWVFNRQLSGLANPDYNRAMYPTIGSYYSCSVIDGISTCDTTASAGMSVSLPPPPEVVNETRVPNDPNFGRDGNGNPLTDLTSMQFIARKGIVFTRNTDKSAYTSSEFPRFIVRPQPVKVLAPSAGPNAHPIAGKPGQGGVAVATVPGFRWTDRSGNWIEYDNFGRVASYGDRNDVRVWMQYSATHYRLERVLDDNGRTVFTLLYTPDGKFITEARDHTGPTVRRVQYGYDGGGRLTSVIDARGNPTYFTYGDHGSVGAINSTASTWFKIKTVKDAEGRLTQVGYGATARMESLTAPDGGVYNFEYTYDKLKKEFGVVIKHPQTEAGRKIEARHVDVEGRVVYREVNGKVLMTASGDRRSMSYTDERGTTATVNYDNFDEITRKANSDGTSTTITYESTSSNVREVVDETGIATRLGHDVIGNLIKLQTAVGLPEEQVTDFTVNTRGEPEVVRREGGALENGNDDPDVEIRLEYDANGNVEKMTDGNGKVWLYEYDAMGNLTRAVDPLNHEWSYSYDDHGNRLTSTDPNHLTSRYTYDKTSRLKTFADPRGKTYSISYDAAGRPLSVVDPTGAMVAVQYDKAGRLISSVDSLNQKIQLAYDNQDRLKSVLDGDANATEFNYEDVDGTDRGSELIAKVTYPTLQHLLRYNSRQGLTQVAEISDGQSRTTSLEYDAHGMVTSLTKPDGNSQSVQRNAFGQVRTATDELGHDARLQYDHRNLLVGVVDSLSHATTFEYDERGHRISETNALGQTTRFDYDDAGRMVALRRPSGARIEFGYDPGGRLTQRQSFRPDGSAEYVDGFTWDDGGRLTEWHTSTASAMLTYDDANRLLSEVVAQAGKSLSRSYTYHPNGQLKTFTGPDGSTVGYDYDGNGLLARVNIPGQGAISITERKWMTPTKVQFPGGTAEEYERKGDLQPTRLRVRSPNQAVLFESKVIYGSLGEVDNRTIQGQLTDLTYDDGQRLVAADPSGMSGQEVFHLDSAGNRLSDNQVTSPWQYDVANRLLLRGQTSYEYDADGNMVRKVDANLAEPQRTTTYRYDGYNQLVEVRDGADQVVSRYGYDAFGYRISKQLTDVGAARSGLAPGLTLFLQASEGLLAEMDSSGQLMRSYGWEPGQPYSTAPLFQRSGNDYYYYHNDNLGTPWLVTNTGGQVVWSAQSYSAFGTPTVASGALAFQPWRFPGQYEDAETGLYYNLRRYYDPAIGRYISSDPIGLAGGPNLYAYASADPVNLYDPRGLIYGNGEWEAEDLVFGPTYWVRETFLGDASVSQAEFDFWDGFANGVVKGTTFGFFDADSIGIIDMSYADRCSEMFRYSTTAGEFWMTSIFPAGRAGYAAESAQLARKYRGATEITEEVARAGVAARNNLKTKYRGPFLGPLLQWWKRPSYEMLRDGLYGSKIPKTDAEIIAGLGKPNFGYTFPLLFGGAGLTGYVAYENQTEPMDGCKCK